MMKPNTNNHIIWEQTARFLSGEMTENEFADFLILIESDIENKKIFEEIKKDWRMMEQMNNKKKIDVNTAWNKLYSRFDEEKLIPCPEKKGKVIQLSTILRIAAVFVGVFLITAGYFVYQNLNTTNRISIYTLQPGEQKTVNLPDGSVVYLNEKSKLIFPEKFNSDKRKVILEGEAFFEVKRNEKTPFIVEANNTEIAVLGTSFNINASFSDKNVEVSVKTGKVQVRSTFADKQKVVLVAGEKVTVTNDKLIKGTNSNENYLAWKTKVMHFNGEKLKDVILIVNHVYRSNIKLSGNSISENRINKTTFEELPLNTVLELLCATFNLKFDIKGTEIILTENDVKPIR